VLWGKKENRTGTAMDQIEKETKSCVKDGKVKVFLGWEGPTLALHHLGNRAKLGGTIQIISNGGTVL